MSNFSYSKILNELSKKLFIYIILQRVLVTQALYVANHEDPNQMRNSISDTRTFSGVSDIKPREVNVGSNQSSDEKFDSDSNIFAPIKLLNTDNSILDDGRIAAPIDTSLYAERLIPPSGPRMNPPAGIDPCDPLQDLFCCLAEFRGCVLYDHHLGPPLCRVDDERTFFACCDAAPDRKRERRKFLPKNCELAPGEAQRRKRFNTPKNSAQQVGEEAWKIITTPYPLWPLIQKAWETKEPGI